MLVTDNLHFIRDNVCTDTKCKRTDTCSVCYTNQNYENSALKGFATCSIDKKYRKLIAILLVSRYIVVSLVSPSTSSSFINRLLWQAVRMINATCAQPCPYIIAVHLYGILRAERSAQAYIRRKTQCSSQDFHEHVKTLFL